MKLKYNINLFKNKRIGINNILNDSIPPMSFNCTNCKQIKNKLLFYTEKGGYIEIPSNIFSKMLIRKGNDTIWLIYDGKNNISGLIGYTMYDTYGFPVEMTQEILEEMGKLDIIGFEILKEIQKEKSNNTKISTAFN